MPISPVILVSGGWKREHWSDVAKQPTIPPDSVTLPRYGRMPNVNLVIGNYSY